MPETYRININVDGEYGEFFVHEYDPVQKGDRTQYMATWCCVSSYGVYGCCWTHMGSPFAKFIAKMDDTDYLLSKISRRVEDFDATVNAVRRDLLASRRAGRITTEQAREWYEELSEAEEWGNLSSVYELPFVDDHEPCMKWEASAEQFAKVLWPEFVRQVGAMVPSNRGIPLGDLLTGRDKREWDRSCQTMREDKE